MTNEAELRELIVQVFPWAKGAEPRVLRLGDLVVATVQRGGKAGAVAYKEHTLLYSTCDPEDVARFGKEAFEMLAYKGVR